MSHTIIIAEAGVNHNGSLQMALELVRAAVEAGADYVKFQTFRAESLVAASAQMANYQKENYAGGDGSQLTMLRKLELSSDDFRRIADECRRHGIGFMSTPFDLEAVDLLSEIGQDYWKIPSGEITNLPLLRKIGSLNAQVVLSSGMSTLAEVEAAVEVLEQSGTPRSQIALLHCTTQYPVPYDSVNLRAIDSLATLGCAAVGYSDHTQGIAIPLAAVARGATIIEKHFTLSRELEGPDHRASLEPTELAEMIRQIRYVEQALGTGTKQPQLAELPNKDIARKSIVAARHIREGETFTEENIATKRPGTGLSPMLWDTVIGTKATRSYRPDEQILPPD